MNANEMMIGDWVYTQAKERNVRVQGVRTDCEVPVVLTDFGDVWWQLHEFEPIPLTGLILEKNGFEKQSESPIAASYRLCLDEDTFSYLFVDFRLRTGLVQVSFDTDMKGPKIGFMKYEMSVHDLQHVMRMCGIEKEIEL